MIVSWCTQVALSETKYAELERSSVFMGRGFDFLDFGWQEPYPLVAWLSLNSTVF
uniref:Uncharacterized protein n=1 Tax=Arundo donax TaxID=35708 RepID=A0A0A9ASS3_ARUDO